MSTKLLRSVLWQISTKIAEIRFRTDIYKKNEINVTTSQHGFMNMLNICSRTSLDEIVSICLKTDVDQNMLDSVSVRICDKHVKICSRTGFDEIVEICFMIHFGKTVEICFRTDFDKTNVRIRSRTNFYEIVDICFRTDFDKMCQSVSEHIFTNILSLGSIRPQSWETALYAVHATAAQIYYWTCER